MEPSEVRKITDFEIETTNFRIDSKNWAECFLIDGTPVRTNPEGDVFEFITGEFAGEQFFTAHAAMRETANAGKTIPLIGEWIDILDSPLGACVATKGGCLQGNFRSRAHYPGGAHYWAHSNSDRSWYCIVVSSDSEPIPRVSSNIDIGFFVRCIKNSGGNEDSRGEG